MTCDFNISKGVVARFLEWNLYVINSWLAYNKKECMTLFYIKFEFRVFWKQYNRKTGCLHP